MEEVREENPLPAIYFLAVRNELEGIKDILEVLVEEREERLKKKKLPWWKKFIKKITG